MAPKSWAQIASYPKKPSSSTPAAEWPELEPKNSRPSVAVTAQELEAGVKFSWSENPRHLVSFLILSCSLLFVWLGSSLFAPKAHLPSGLFLTGTVSTTTSLPNLFLLYLLRPFLATDVVLRAFLIDFSKPLLQKRTRSQLPTWIPPTTLRLRTRLRNRPSSSLPFSPSLPSLTRQSPTTRSVSMRTKTLMTLRLAPVMSVTETLPTMSLSKPLLRTGSLPTLPREASASKQTRVPPTIILKRSKYSIVPVMRTSLTHPLPRQTIASKAPMSMPFILPFPIQSMLP